MKKSSVWKLENNVKHITANFEEILKFLTKELCGEGEKHHSVFQSLRGKS